MYRQVSPRIFCCFFLAKGNNFSDFLFAFRDDEPLRWDSFLSELTHMGYTGKSDRDTTPFSSPS